jgi:shikimate kinase
MKRYSNPLVILTGPKHAGKTSAGQALARLRRGKFIDLDELVETQTGKSPRALYNESPERFREAEARGLETIVSESESDSEIIAAAGGGLIDNPAALKALENRPVVLAYLDVSPETAWNRIAGQGNPLPPFLDTQNPRETHEKIHRRRGADYKALAHIVVQGDGKPPIEIAQEIADGLVFLDGEGPLA